MQVRKNFAWPVTDTYPGNIAALQQCLETHREALASGRLVLFGSGIHGCEVLKLLEKKGRKVHCFIDNNTEKQGGYIDEYPILSLDEVLSTVPAPRILVCIENPEGVAEQLTGAGLQKNVDFFFAPSHIYADYVEEFSRPCTDHLLIMGDCCLTAVALLDDDYTSLASLLSARLASVKTKVLAMHGMGMRAYYHMLRLQCQLGMRPRSVLLEVNFETFMPRYHLLPRSQHVPLLERIQQVAGCHDAMFDAYVAEARQRFANFQTDAFSSSAQSHKNRISASSAALFFRLNYMYALDCQIEGFVYYLKILDFCRDNGLAVTLFVPPVNYKYADDIIGPEFRQAYAANLQLLCEKTEPYGCRLVTLSYALPPEEFCAPETPTETCNYRGRQHLCELLSDAMVQR